MGMNMAAENPNYKIRLVLGLAFDLHLNPGFFKLPIPIFILKVIVFIARPTREDNMTFCFD